MKKLISRYLDTVGDGSGTKNANGDYSVTPDEFLFTPDSGETANLTRMIISVEDTTGFTASEYGNLAAALTNGIKIEVKDASGVVYSLTDPDNPVKDNSDWGHMCYDANMLTWGAGNETLVVRWTFTKMGKPVVLRSHAGEYLAVTLNDDLQGLVNHFFLVQGYESEEI